MSGAEYEKYLNDKRAEILPKVKQVCDLFGVECDYIINLGEGQTETLVLDGVRIGCTANSEGAILCEVVGFLFLRYYARYFYVDIPKRVKERIKRYWIK